MTRILSGYRAVHAAAAVGMMTAGALAEQACSGAGIPIVYTGVPDAGNVGTGSSGTGSGSGHKNPDASTYTVPFPPGNGMPCTGMVGGFPAADCDPSDEMAQGCMPYGMSNGCTFAAQCGDPTTCEPFTQNPLPDKGVDNFRMRLINITAPPALASMAIQNGVVTAAVNLPPDAGCNEQGSGLFNWLISVDKTKGQITTGGAPASTDPFKLGYCFVNGTVVTTKITPSTLKATFTGNKFSTEVTPKLNIPIFLAPSGQVILPISGATLKDVAVSPDGNCIGAMNQASLIAPGCVDNAASGASSCSQWHSAGTLGGYITLADADTVLVQLLSESLCVLLTHMGDGAAPVQHCVPAALHTGNYCSGSGGTLGKACTGGDSYWLSAQFAASAVKIYAGSSSSPAICNGGTIGG